MSDWIVDQLTTHIEGGNACAIRRCLILKISFKFLVTESFVLFFFSSWPKEEEFDKKDPSVLVFTLVPTIFPKRLPIARWLVGENCPTTHGENKSILLDDSFLHGFTV